MLVLGTMFFQFQNPSTLQGMKCLSCPLALFTAVANYLTMLANKRSAVDLYQAVVAQSSRVFCGNPTNTKCIGSTVEDSLSSLDWPLRKYPPTTAYCLLYFEKRWQVYRGGHLQKLSSSCTVRAALRILLWRPIPGYGVPCQALLWWRILKEVNNCVV